MNMATLFDRSKVEALAARHGAALSVIDSGGSADDTPLYAIPVMFDFPVDGRADVTFDDDSKRWTVDPYFGADAVLTSTETRSLAKVLESAATLADELNVPDDVAPWETIKGMTIDQLDKYSKSIGSTAGAVISVVRPK